MSSSQAVDPAVKQSNVLLILFPGFNTLDMNGPYDVLTKSSMNKAFKIDVASETPITKSVEGVQVQRDVALDAKLIECLDKYEILIVPGGLSGDETKPVDIQASKTNGAFMTLIRTYSALEADPSGPERILLSICTGAIFLGTLGIFNSRFCTTHWKAYDGLYKRLENPAVKMPGSPGKLVPARFVDAGVNDAKVRIISSGGISCGMDASLHVVKLRCGEDEARSTAELLDYAWRKTEGAVFDWKPSTLGSTKP